LEEERRWERGNRIRGEDESVVSEGGGRGGRGEGGNVGDGEVEAGAKGKGGEKGGGGERGEE